jgi:hypothetical protein
MGSNRAGKWVVCARISQSCACWLSRSYSRNNGAKLAKMVRDASSRQSRPLATVPTYNPYCNAASKLDHIVCPGLEISAHPLRWPNGWRQLIATERILQSFRNLLLLFPLSYLQSYEISTQSHHSQAYQEPLSASCHIFR